MENSAASARLRFASSVPARGPPLVLPESSCCVRSEIRNDCNTPYMHVYIRQAMEPNACVVEASHGRTLKPIWPLMLIAD